MNVSEPRMMSEVSYLIIYQSSDSRASNEGYPKVPNHGEGP